MAMLVKGSGQVQALILIDRLSPCEGTGEDSTSRRISLPDEEDAHTPSFWLPRSRRTCRFGNGSRAHYTAVPIAFVMAALA